MAQTSIGGGIFLEYGEVGQGEVRDMLALHASRPMELQPYAPSGENWKTGPQYGLTVNAKGESVKVPITANALTLPYEGWRHVESTILDVARAQLGFVSDVMASNFQDSVPGGWAKSIYTKQRRSDSGKAQISMDPGVPGERTRSLINYDTIPLPLIHGDWSFGVREIDQAANEGFDLDTIEIANITRRIYEIAEELFLGTRSYSFMGFPLYGLTNHPQRVTGSLTDPASGGWTGLTLYNETLAMRQALYLKRQYGPYRLYVGRGWDQYLDRKWSTNYDAKTIRRQIEDIGSENGGSGRIESIKTLDYLPSLAMCMVQWQKRSIRALNIVPLRPIRWTTPNGLGVAGKVIWGVVPEMQRDDLNQLGVAHYTV